MKAPNGYSGKKRVRDFEKRVLEGVYDDLCRPGDHRDLCARGNRRCPHRHSQSGGNNAE